MRRQTLRLTIPALVILVALALVAPLPAGASPLANGIMSASAYLPPAGGWVAYGFNYDGSGTTVGITLTYTPVDDATERPNAVTLDLYSPKNPPPNGASIASASRTASGQRQLTFGSNTAGQYVIIVHNWDPGHRTLLVQVTISTGNGAISGLQFISSSSGVVLASGVFLPGISGFPIPGIGNLPIPGIGSLPSIPGLPSIVPSVTASCPSFPLPGGGTATYCITLNPGGTAHVKMTISGGFMGNRTFEFDMPGNGQIGPSQLMPFIPWR